MVGPENSNLPVAGDSSNSKSSPDGLAGKPARFYVAENRNGHISVFDRESRVFGVEECEFLACDFRAAGPREYATEMCDALNRLDAERRGDNPSDVQRQLLDELRELIKIQKQGLADVKQMVNAQVVAIRGMNAETKRPEPNVNDLMLEIGRAFGLSDLQTMNLENLKGFCCAAWRMSHVPQRATRPLLLLVARGALDASAVEVSGAKEALAKLGLA